MCRYGQKVTLVKKWVNYMPRKGVENSHFANSSPCSGSTRVSAALTNMKLGIETKLCDPTNIGMVKIMHFLEKNKKQSWPIHFDWHMYVHVTDKENDSGKLYGSISLP